MARDSLEEWEEFLRPQVEEVDLLGEIDISEEELPRLGQQIGDLVRRYGWAEAERLIREKYPCSFAVFLVAQGAREYEAGDFWSSIRRATNLPIPPNQTRDWGQLFEDIVATLPVVLHQSHPMGGRRYVDLILAHGGIPVYCLADFFEHFIDPLTRQPENAVLSTEEFIQKRLRHYTAVYLTDEPVLRFLEHGGSVAIDFVERCREMARQYNETGAVPTPEEVGLPPRVVEEYQAWLEGHPRPSLRQPTIYRSPVLFLDPWGLGVAIRLPSQPAPAPQPGLCAVWVINWGDDGESVEVSILREEKEWRTESGIFALPQPAPAYTVRFSLVQDEGNQFDREWSLPGAPGDCPLLWFSPKDGALIPPRGVLPAEELWLLRAPEVSLQADPPIALRVTERLPRQPGKWSDWIAEAVDLSAVQLLTAYRNNVVVREYEVRGRSDQGPALEGANCLPIDGGRPPLYVGAPPLLRIPLLSLHHLHRWHVTLWNEAPAIPEVNRSLTLDEPGAHPEIGESCAFLHLSTFLGEEPFGTYRVKVRGPLGQRADLAFRVLPHLEIVGHETLYLPESADNARFLVETDAQTEVALPPDLSGCRIERVKSERNRTVYEVTAGLERETIPLRLTRRNDAGDIVSVPLSIPIRRLRWRVVLDPERGLLPQWQMAAPSLPLDALEQGRESPFLLVDLFGGVEEPVKVVLRLEDDREECIQEMEGRLRPGQPYLRFDLAPFMDTLRHTPAAHFVFRLLLYNVPGLPVQASYPVLRVTRRFTVQQAGVDAVYEGEKVYLRLRWKTTLRVRGRFARLWPLWRPWEGPAEIPIPDNADEEHWCALPAAQLPPGRYLLEFGVRAPWASAPSSAERPSPDDPTVTLVLIPPDAVAQRLKEARRQAAEGPLPFPLVLEIALLRRDVGQEELARQDLQWCSEHLDEAGWEHVLAFVQAVTGMPELEVPSRMKMASPHRLRRVMEDFRRGALAESLYREYLRLLPRPESWGAETCKLLLEVEDAERRFQAIQQLLRREPLAGARAVVRWLQDEVISDEEGLRLLERSISHAVQALREAFPHPAALRLLEKLGDQYPDRVPPVRIRPGHWVRCVAGWGRIERIEGADGKPREYFWADHPEPGLRLRVLLRAHHARYAEEVVVNLQEKTVTFTQSERVYTCDKCGRFASGYYDRITGEHDRAAHQGMGASFQAKQTPVLQQSVQMEFSFRPPSNPWV